MTSELLEVSSCKISGDLESLFGDDESRSTEFLVLESLPGGYVESLVTLPFFSHFAKFMFVCFFGFVWPVGHRRLKAKVHLFIDV